MVVLRAARMGTTEVEKENAEMSGEVGAALFSIFGPRQPTRPFRGAQKSHFVFWAGDV